MENSFVVNKLNSVEDLKKELLQKAVVLVENPSGYYSVVQVATRAVVQDEEEELVVFPVNDLVEGDDIRMVGYDLVGHDFASLASTFDRAGICLKENLNGVDLLVGSPLFNRTIDDSQTATANAVDETKAALVPDKSLTSHVGDRIRWDSHDDGIRCYQSNRIDLGMGAEEEWMQKVGLISTEMPALLYLRYGGAGIFRDRLLPLPVYHLRNGVKALSVISEWK